jgi:hypothetical protein
MAVQRGAKVSETQWKDWLNRDDRSGLESLSQDSWSSRVTLENLRDLLDSIVTAEHFSSHQRWGTTPSKSSLESLKKDFADWLRESGEWSALHASWKKDTHGPWSLPYFLARACHRFRCERAPSSIARGELAFSHSGPDTAAAIASVMHDAFVSMTHRLPERCKLSYQLHLEGLINPEIASLLSLELGEVEEHLREAKHFLDEAIVGYGT